MSQSSDNSLKCSELGKKSDYQTQYNPDLLFPVARQSKRHELNIDSDHLPFRGYDCWNHYEVSWLNPKGKPVVAVAEIYYSCESVNIIESKSFKLYFNSFNNTKFNSIAEVEGLIRQDIAKCIDCLNPADDVVVKVYDLCDPKISSNKNFNIASLDNNTQSTNLDTLDISCTEYTVNPDLLELEQNSTEIITESVCSDLLKSNCLVTYQPDWGSVFISYTGPKINHESLLKYIVSYRNHNEFHEQCIERIFIDIMTRCKPTELTVQGRYTRRGGLDINPYRTNKAADIQYENNRLIRQ